jgi:hypothetical protein
MKRFKTFINEKVENVSWLKSALHYTTKRYGLYIPISLPIWKKYIIDARGITFHKTGPKGFENLLKIQDSSKSVSSFQKLERHYLTVDAFSGDWGKTPDGRDDNYIANIIAVLYGNISMATDNDMMSEPDENGRRWIDITKLKTSTDDYDKLLKKKDDLSDAFMSKYGIKEISEIPYFAKDIDDETTKKEFNKDVSILIAAYYDSCTDFLKRNANAIKDLVISNLETTPRGYNEILTHDFEVVGVIYINDPYHDRDKDVFNDRIAFIKKLGYDPDIIKESNWQQFNKLKEKYTKKYIKVPKG